MMWHFISRETVNCDHGMQDTRIKGCFHVMVTAIKHETSSQSHTDTYAGNPHK